MDSNSVKILTLGAAAGSIREILSKIKAIDDKHGKFDFVLCTGDFFGLPDESTESDIDDDEVSLLLDGKLEVPVECYIMQGKYPLPPKVIQKFSKTGGELCSNMFLMGKSGTITTANGIRIACLGGVYDAGIYSSVDAAPGFVSPYFSTHTKERLLANCFSTVSTTQSYNSLASIQSNLPPSQLVDILLSNVWPSRIAHSSACPVPQNELFPIIAPPLDEIVRRIRPRYHITTGGGSPPFFWEREPFVWDEEEGRVMRFISLGAFGGGTLSSGKKQRWFYAFSISPKPTSSPLLPSNVTSNPFTEPTNRGFKRSFETSEGTNFIFGDHFIIDCPERSKPPEGYICKLCTEPGHFVRDCPSRDAVGDTGGRKPKPGYVCRACGSEEHYLDDCLTNRSAQKGDRRPGHRGPAREIAPDECWFCLSNPNLAKHLIVSIGSEVYVTLPKGQIVPTQSTSDPMSIPGGGHVLIVPITHYPTYTTIPPELAPPIMEETEKYKSALRAFFSKHGCSFVMFEVGRLSAKGGHAHVQVVPIPRALEDRVEDEFIREGRAVGIDFERDAEEAMNLCAGGKGGYFKVELPDGRKMVHLIREHVPFNLQFGRCVAVQNVPE
ncbi:hypothetical protein AGABI1DRAFT_104513 [Agaricus bisporus var. burnettii JB137-S8]|uniref:CCHC-type domain-containing protein n=1 Tax=Agaricus bisporus var. burnettii (strain JB137-S8 / ATCC MYA-4627 / FGSC 10392) TaxID=597362 RepID=K5W6Z0_AGABU|nr:uncharacterized protein AGABI1DRAFT_104513 [Agaricus bisporus var. burnettii JB137-S8]EKM82574.1 hypothetical protein AGABI1DRAFT_104513 [Agaricus bisporus var. burnettii JB137-S8]